MSVRPSHANAQPSAHSWSTISPVLTAILTVLMLQAIWMVPISDAIMPVDRGQIAIELPSHQTSYLYAAAEIAADPAALASGAALVEELGAGWRVTAWNQYARAPRTAYGPGVMVAPGGLESATETEVELLARNLVARHARFFGTDGSNLELKKIVHAVGKWSVIFRQVEAGVRIRNTAVMLAFNDSGKMFRVGANLYSIDVSLQPTIERTVARTLARAAVPYDPTTDLTPGWETLMVLPIHRAPGEVDLRLTHRFDVPTSEPYALWRTYVDAHTGEIVERTDRINHLYEGSVLADAEISSYCDGDSPDAPFPNTYVEITDVGTATTDASGDFSIAGDSGAHPTTVVLDGLDFYVDCIDCGGQATWTGTIEPNTPLPIYFDAITYRPDERDTYYFANATKHYMWTIDPTFTIHKYRIETNYDSSCNATHNWGEQRLRFYREAGGCINTGRLGDVIAHEFGHGIQASMHDTTQAQQGLGEGNSDIIGTFMTDDPLIARGWDVDQCDTGLGRHCVNDLVYPDDVVGQEIHFAGQVICGFNWDCRMALEASMGPVAGKAYTADLWHYSRKMFGHEDMTQPEQVDAYFVIDDDDGNLINGTPNFEAIYDAATNHGFGPYIIPNPNRLELEHAPLVDTLELGPFDIEATVRTYDTGVPVAPSAVELYYSINAGPYTMLPMSSTSGDTLFGVAIPEVEDGTVVAYYIRATYVLTGLEVFHPIDAPASRHLFAVGGFDMIVDHPMEATDDYTVGYPGDTAVNGIWERGDPIGVTFGPLVLQPEDDHTAEPGTDCWITGNSASPPPFGAELDGRTTLLTPVIDMSAANMVQGSLWAFTYFAVPGGAVALDLDVSSDGGTNWTNVLHINQHLSPNWTEFSFRLSPMEHEITDQMRFRFVADDPPPGSLADVLLDDFYVEGLFTGSTGVGAATATTPLTLSLGRATPNPFNPSTVIHYRLPARAEVGLAIYDVQGRLVRQLVAGVQDPGDHVARWDGRNAAGGAAASGVYFYRMEVGDWNESRTLVLLK